MNTEHIAKARSAGSTATTPAGAARWLVRNHQPPRPLPLPGDDGWFWQPQENDHSKIPSPWILDRMKAGDTLTTLDEREYGYNIVPRSDNSAADRAREVIGPRGQRSNWGPGVPQLYGQPHQARWEEFSYRGICKGYKGRYLHIDYQSCVAASPSGRTALVILECKVLRRLIAPKGLRFAIDSWGIYIFRLSDGMDYHPTDSEWVSGKFWTIVRERMAENYSKRLEAKRLEQQNKRLETLFKRDLPTTRVTLDDSRRAGNCVAGTLSFAATRLGVDPQELVESPWLVSVSADRVMRTEDPRAARAARAAWARETTVSI